MFKNLFKKKNITTEKDSWSLYESRDGNFPIYIRFSNFTPTKLQDYPHMISIFWAYPQEDKTGLPSEEVLNAHHKLEEALNPLDDKINSFYMAQITGNGRQEWIWYTNDVDTWWNNFNNALKKHPKYPLDIQLGNEPLWDRYHAIKGNY